jgi:hypothetical protein
MNMTEVAQVQKPTTLTRRTFLVRDLKAICAMAAVPLAAGTMFPTAAVAQEPGGGWGRGGIWGWGWLRGWGWSWGGWGWGWGGGHGGGGDHGGGGNHGGGGGHCFLKGTKILTATGERPIEDLAVGDLLPTAFGGTRPIQWIGRFRRVRTDANKPWVRSALPVRIARSALAANVPHTDLLVTQGHAVLLDGILIPAGSLINGSSISLETAESSNELEFFHIKLETHDVIYAEGAPCETLLAVDETMSNFADYLRKYGATEPATGYCAPVICKGRRNEFAVRLRSLMSPWLGPQKFDDIRMALELQATELV